MYIRIIIVIKRRFPDLQLLTKASRERSQRRIIASYQLSFFSESGI